MSEAASSKLPEFLESFENLTAHFDEHFGELGSNERGDTFLNLAQKLVPLSAEGEAFPLPHPSEKKSHDAGVDLLTDQSPDGRILYAQSKYKLRDKDAIDSVISKFKHFEDQLGQSDADQASLFVEQQQSAPTATFFIVTSSKLEGILRRYEKSTLASREYYEQLQAEDRLVILDGPRILSLLQQLYRKAHVLPATLTLVSPLGWLNQQEVYFGVVGGQTLAALYREHGDALFFENIRDFLGTSSGRAVTTRSTVNQEIIGTISKAPVRMLARNNGVTFRASKVSLAEDGGGAVLDWAAIVNGCQTTMCLVQCEPVAEECFIPVKIVVTEDAWDIAKAANYQNQVARVDLDLARYLRPQLARRVATTLGYAIEGDTEETASGVLNTIYQNKVNYEEMRLLYLGLFSRRPSNLFEANYTELRSDILERLYDRDNAEEEIFAVLLLILKAGRDGLNRSQETFSGPEYAQLFRRFFAEDKPRYRAFLAIASMAAQLRDDISDRATETDKETERMISFLGKSRETLENSPELFLRAYRHTFQAIADSLLDIPTDRGDAEIAQGMFQKVSRMAFSSLLKKVLMRIDADKAAGQGQA